jgi:putative Mg2+ transporter-C (MgtC) family protein
MAGRRLARAEKRKADWDRNSQRQERIHKAVLLDLDLQIAVKLAMAALLGGIVGLERQMSNKPAGLRTNMLICVGSTLFTLLSEQLAIRFGGDPVRIASQLIPGIGFIGAGTILRDGATVKGLTTAASVFVIASVGMAIGGGLYVTAVFATGLMVIALWLLGWMEERWSSSNEKEG